jgi:tRNA pseudouridine38-40 synthase
MKVTSPATGTRVVLIIEYEGTNYHGSQWQANAQTIQGEVEKALQKLTGENLRIKAASRTDAGVHASGQVVSFDICSSLPLNAFIEGMNYYLPPDIAVREAFWAEGSFDVRRHAVSREYRYYILNSTARSPLKRGLYHRVAGNLDVEVMDRACQALVGKHDFASFTSGAGIGKKSTVRTVQSAGVERDGDMIIFKIVANSYLPHQVRNIVGPLIKVGQGRMTVDEFGDLVEAKIFGLAGPTAPATGLCLVRVDYPRPFDGDAA